METTTLKYPPELLNGQPFIWYAPAGGSGPIPEEEEGRRAVSDAIARWVRFGPLLTALFPEIACNGGHIDSPLLAVPPAARLAFTSRNIAIAVKADHLLPLTGSVKARGGVYEVLLHAEKLALAAGIVSRGEPYVRLAGPAARSFFAKHRLAVGSTGNLGFSVGLMGRALGFEVEVHMSRDAKSWKKERLRALGATVVEHAGDYALAVQGARSSCSDNVSCYFVDDEHSFPLFWGYAAAAFDLKEQIDALGIEVSTERPLDVFLPCGVGGAPGGITYGLKLIYGDAVRCVWVEPTQSPCMLTQLISDGKPTSVYELGLTNATVADGLAVAAASMLVNRLAGPLLAAIATANDEMLLDRCKVAWNTMELRLEPAAVAGFAALDAHLKHLEMEGLPPAGLSVVWTTGGGKLPDEEFELILEASSVLRLR